MRWSPTAKEGFGPKISPGGHYVAFGQSHVHLAHIKTGDEWLLGRGGQPQWIRPGQVAWLEHAPDGESAVRHDVLSAKLLHTVVLDDQELYAGTHFAAAEGHWANAHKGRIVYDGRVIIEANGSLPRVCGDYLAHVTKGTQIWVHYGNATVKARFDTAIADVALQRNGDVVFIDSKGSAGWFAFDATNRVHKFPYNGDERLLSSFEHEGRPWVASLVKDIGDGKEYLVLRDLNRDEFFMLPSPAEGAIALDAATSATELIVALTSPDGRLRVQTYELARLLTEAA